MGDGILAFDWGLKKVGVAKSDLQGIAISPRDVWKRKPAGQMWSLTLEDKADLRSILEREDPEFLVLGEPRGPEGEETQSSLLSQKFRTRLEELLGLPVALVPEQNTSWEHDGTLEEDSLVAASLIESFLNDPTLHPVRKAVFSRVIELKTKERLSK